MAKDRTILYTLKVVNDPANAKAASEQIKMFREVEAAAKAATKAMNEAAAARRGGGSSVGGSSGSRSSGGGRGYSGATSFDRGITAATRKMADERRELERNIREEQRARENSLRDMQLAAAQEKKILADRVRANLEASAAIRRAAAEARAEGGRRRQAAGAASASANAAGQAAYLAGDGFSDADALKHVESLGKTAERAHDATAKAAERAAAKTAHANRELLSGMKQTAAGIGNVARAFVYLGVSGEENLAKAVQMLAKFEAGMAGIRGVSDIASGGVKAYRAYRGMGAGGLAAGIGAVGVGSTALAGGAALAVGGGIGFGIGRAAIGGDSFGRMTDNWGITNYAGERRAAAMGRNATRANQWIAQRSGVDQQYSDFEAMQSIRMQHAEATGGLFGARDQAYKNSDEAFARNRDVQSRIASQPGMAPEVASREMANANASQVQAMSTLIGLRQQELSLVNQTLASEKAKTQAVMEQVKAAQANIGLADKGTLRLAESGAKKIRLNQELSQEEIQAIGIVSPEASQNEAAKRGQSQLANFPEIRAMLDAITAAEKARSDKVLIELNQKVTGTLTVSPDAEKTKADLEIIINQWNTQLRDMMQKQLELNNADRESQDALRRNTSG